MESLNSNLQERELHQLHLEARQMYSNDMTCFKGLESHLRINAKSCLKNSKHSFRNFLTSAHSNPILQENFKDYMGCEPETYRSNLLKYLDILAKCIDKRVFKYYELVMKVREIKEIKETEKLLNEAIPHEHEIKKSFKMQSKDVQINSVQVVDANLVVTETSGIESENNSLENALSKSVNETQM
ncbi:hypothetical protein Tco_0526967 [Tanacetum coccineum]